MIKGFLAHLPRLPQPPRTNVNQNCSYGQRRFATETPTKPTETTQQPEGKLEEQLRKNDLETLKEATNQPAKSMQPQFLEQKSPADSVFTAPRPTEE